MTSRRGFLGAMAAALVLDPERLLWKPGAKLISIPTPRVLLPLYYETRYSHAWRTQIFRLFTTTPDSIRAVDMHVEPSASRIRQTLEHSEFVLMRAQLAQAMGVAADDFAPPSVLRVGSTLFQAARSYQR